MFLINLLFLLAVPALTNAGLPPTSPTRLDLYPVLSSVTPNVTGVTCTAVDLQHMNDSWINVHYVYSAVIKNYFDGREALVEHELQVLQTNLQKLSATLNCTKRHNRVNESLNLFYDLVNFTVSNDGYKKFIQNSGSLCILATHANISGCITNEYLRNNSRIDHKFLASLKLGSADGCDGGNQMKNCMTRAMKTAPKVCTENNIEFVNSLMDFVLNKKCTSNITDVASLKGSANTFYSARNVILTTLTALTFI